VAARSQGQRATRIIEKEQKYGSGTPPLRRTSAQHRTATLVRCVEKGSLDARSEGRSGHLLGERRREKAPYCLFP